MSAGGENGCLRADGAPGSPAKGPSDAFRAAWEIRPHMQSAGETISWIVGPMSRVPGIEQPAQYVLAIVKDRIEHARLIAAAPKLLSLAKRWAALDGGAWHVGRHAQDKAELLAETLAAIAKAEGSSEGLPAREAGRTTPLK
jgi:hypothetical protein